jgi:hypothetical protein
MIYASLIAVFVVSDLGQNINVGSCRRFGPARTLKRPVNLSLRVPAQMG